MGKKWQRIDPATVKVGDRVRIKYLGMARNDYSTVTGTVRKIDHYGHISSGDGFLRSPSTGDRTWYVRKPKPAKDTYYAELEAEVKEIKADSAETQAQLNDAMLKIAEQRTELEKWKAKAVALAKQTRADAREAELTRPDEPPVGTFFRVDRTGSGYVMFTGTAPYFCFDSIFGEVPWRPWEDITEPGDTITLLHLVERDRVSNRQPDRALGRHRQRPVRAVGREGTRKGNRMNRYIVHGRSHQVEILMMTVNSETQCEEYVTVAWTDDHEWAHRIVAALEEADA